LPGDYEAPIYGMLAVNDAIDEFDWKAKGLVKPEVSLNGQPADESKTHVAVGRRMGNHLGDLPRYGRGVHGRLAGHLCSGGRQFRSFKLPLVILTPIPLTLVGIVLGHMLFSAPFTATSMIGFIALAGIIVRNSILLVDFIRHARAPTSPCAKPCSKPA
jgi:hypothetical protein